MEKIRTRQEIVEKMEEMYKLLKDNKQVNVPRVILAGDVLDWVLGDSDYLDTNTEGEIEWLKY